MRVVTIVAMACPRGRRDARAATPAPQPPVKQGLAQPITVEVLRRIRLPRMLSVDVFSGYLIGGVGSLIGAAMLRVADASDLPTQRALRLCGWGFVALGLGLMPAGTGAAVDQAAGRFSLAFGTLAGLLLVGCGLGELQGKHLPRRGIAGLLLACALVMAAALAIGARGFGVAFEAAMVAVMALGLWLSRGMVARPRELTERALGVALVALALSCVARLGFTLAHDEPARADMGNLPADLRSVLAIAYGVLPLAIATLLLTMVNARLRRQLRQRASTDELTGTMTRRALREQAPELIREHQRDGREVAVMMLDLDRFKQINDGHGHQTGDDVLRLATRALQAHVRDDSLLARYGGEEFVAVVPVDDLPGARRVAERLRHAVESVAWIDRLRLPQGVTVSIGVALVDPGETLDSALQRADEALYRAKRDGRNQCQVALGRA